MSKAKGHKKDTNPAAFAKFQTNNLWQPGLNAVLYTLRYSVKWAWANSLMRHTRLYEKILPSVK